MSSIKSTPKLSPFSQIRMHVEAALRGPRDILWPSQTSTESSDYGWPVLSLALSSSQTDQMEYRTIYANYLNEDQNTAILRAVYWDGETSRKAFRKEEANFVPALSAKFSSIRADDLLKCLSFFNDTSITISSILPSKKLKFIKKIRIEYDYASNTYESSWSSDNLENEVFEQKWNKIWFLMTEILDNAYINVDVEENYWLVQPIVVYDFQTYQSNFLL